MILYNLSRLNDYFYPLYVHVHVLENMITSFLLKHPNECPLYVRI